MVDGMSLYINFEEHSWYKGFAIKDYGRLTKENSGNARSYRWEAYTDDGNTYRIVELEADTLKELKQLITEYRSK